MERLRRVNQIWNWLPAFRAVAETEHLPTAAKQLHVSPSALSRTVKLIEDDLGVPLFHRVGRRIVLNEAGQALLRRTRDAMRLVHDAILETQGSTLEGPVYVASSGLVTVPYVVPGLGDLQQEYPQIDVVLESVPLAQVPLSLVTGKLDVSFQSVPVGGDEVHVEHLGDARNGIYCGPGHPLYDAVDPTLEEVLGHGFASPPGDEFGRTWEGWPVHVERKVSWQIGQMHVGLAVCAQGRALAVFPDVIAAARRELRRFELELVPDTPVYAVTRPRLDTRTKADAVVEAVARRIAADQPDGA